MKEALISLISPAVAVALIAAVGAVMTARAALVDVALKRRLDTAKRFTELAEVANDGSAGYYQRLAAMELIASFGLDEPHLRQAARTVLDQMQAMKQAQPAMTTVNLAKAAGDASHRLPEHGRKSGRLKWLGERVPKTPKWLLVVAVAIGGFAFVVSVIAALWAGCAKEWPDFLVFAGLAAFSGWGATAMVLSRRQGRDGIGGSISLIALVAGSFLALYQHPGQVGGVFPSPTPWTATCWLLGVLATIVGLEVARQSLPRS